MSNLQVKYPEYFGKKRGRPPKESTAASEPKGTPLAEPKAKKFKSATTATSRKVSAPGSPSSVDDSEDDSYPKK